MGRLNFSAENFSFWKNMILATLFFTITPLVILSSLVSLFSLSRVDKNNDTPEKLDSYIQSPKSGVRVYASLPTSFPSFSGFINSADARKEIVRQYLSDYESPLEPYAPSIVDTAGRIG